MTIDQDDLDPSLPVRRYHVAAPGGIGSVVGEHNNQVIHVHHPRDGRRRHHAYLAVASVLALVALVGLALLLRGQLDRWWAIATLAMAGATVVALLVWISGREHLADDAAGSAEIALDRLRTKVLEQWRREAATRGLHQPRPLRLRWHPTTRPVEIAATGVGRLARGALVQDPADPRPVAHALVDAFRTDPRHQLVVLGEPGSGKTTLAILYTLAAITAGEPSDPVPVLLSVAGWRPWSATDGTGEHIETWVLRRIAEDHPELAGSQAARRRLRALWQRRRLMPILDGLDEMPDALLDRALQDLDRSAGEDFGLVVTCRTQEFQRTITAANALSRAAVVDIEAIGVEDAADYLNQRELADTQRWDRVLESMRQDPQGPLAEALSTPLMISLARQIYQAPQSDPAELTGFTTAEDIQHHLLAQYLPSVYPHEKDRARATRWLAFLAHHLRNRLDDSNLEWWQLARAVPQAVITSLVAASVTVFALLAFAFAEIAVRGSSANPLKFIPPGLIIGAAFGVILGPRAGRSAHRTLALPKHSRATSVLIAVTRDAGTLLGILSAITVALLLTSWLAAPQAAIRVSLNIAYWVSGVWSGADALPQTLLVMVIVLGVLTVTRYLSELSGGLPQRSRPSLQKLWPSLLFGLTIGLVSGAPWMLLGMGSQMPAREAFGLCLMTTGFVGVPLGVGRWLATPVAREQESSPQTVLRGDRTGLLVTVVSSGLVGALSAAVGAWTMTAGDDENMVLGIGVAIGVCVAVVVLFGSGTAWLSYTVARLWLALWSRLPLRLNTFLRHAHKAGVLRQTGPAYQLRHDLLTTHLARQWRPGRGLAECVTRRTRVRRRRSWIRPVLGVAAVVALLAMVTKAYDHYGPHALDGAIPDKSTMAFSQDGNALATVDRQTSALQLWDVATGKRTWRLPIALPGDPLDISLGRDGSSVTVVAYGFDRHNDPSTGRWVVLRGEPRTGRPAYTLDAVTEHLNSGQIRYEQLNPNGDMLTSVDSRGTVQLWDMRTDRLARTLNLPTEIRIPRTSFNTDGHYLGPSIVFSPDSRHLGVISMGTWNAVWNLETGEQKLHPPLSPEHWIEELSLSRDGRTLATLDYDDTARLWDLPTGTMLGSRDSVPPYDTTLSHDATTLASGDTDSVRTWDLRDEEQIGTFTPPPSLLHDEWTYPQQIIFSPDDRVIAVQNRDNTVQLWTLPPR